MSLNEESLNVRSAPADSPSFYTMGKNLYISCSGEAESKIRKSTSCFYDLKNVIDRPAYAFMLRRKEAMFLNLSV